MDTVFLRRFARRMHELMLRARTEAAREQLRIWAEEFDARAAALDAEQHEKSDHGDPRDPIRG